ncbi:AAA family ATPase [Candidatus Formimonas warabiya]|uniref:Nuclease SbcCD subunit C n=1 Tax=Formimonas warabiya TaxID=1761012 RepID=A0A3G1KNT6_FORW1|nr:SMC family ATPase [Candidatus Formimonas warabiya]ATW24133.1 hypothetical protein DCMF_04465 [Candidatus Formimonas warabiya]
MIPLRIEATNIGAVPHVDIDLSNINLASICGPNGVGKSTIFTIAPVFALFGETKNSCGMDNMVRLGTQEMDSTLEFEHRGEIYRVIRTRSTKGKGKTTLELQRLIEDPELSARKWDSLSGTTTWETEDKIKELLNLDAETFLASSMILQGKANEFTSKPAGQRKAILAQILGLEIYDRLLEKAKEKERAVNIELEKAKAKLSELDTRLVAKPAVESERAVCLDEISRIEAEIQSKESELRQARDRVRQLEIKQQRARELDRQIDTLWTEIEQKESEKSEHGDKLVRAQKILDSEAQILSKSNEHEQVKQRITVLQTKQPRLSELDIQERQIRGELVKIESQLTTTSQQVTKTETILACQSELEQAVNEFNLLGADIERLDKLAETFRIQELNAIQKKAAWEKKDTEIENRAKELNDQISGLKKKVEMLGNSGCINPENAQCRFLADAQDAKKKLPDLEKELASIDGSQIQPYWEEYQNAKRSVEELKYDPLQHKQSKERLNFLRPKVEQAAQLDSKQELLQNLKQQKSQAEEQKGQILDRIKGFQAERIKLVEELKPLTELEARLPKLAQWAQVKDQLPAARGMVAVTNETIAKLKTEIELKRKTAYQLGNEKNEIDRWVDNLPTELGGIADLEENLGTLRKELTDYSTRAGVIDAQLKSLEKDEEERRQIKDQIIPLAKDLVRWQTLVKAYGRDGIPALIIENAVPELERIANEILGQMSKGEHSLRFETQRDLKSRAGVKETLDIIVSDWIGDRPYETFSGGEQLRIDFAIRFALAELLARRAGSRVEWLTIDEGLGSQDAVHRGLVLEAIKSVADRFRKVLVITHIEEAQAVFEQQIYLEPGEDGVRVKLAA